MDSEVFNLSVRKFLKRIGVGSQREIEHAIQDAIRQQALTGRECLTAKVTLEIPAVGLSVPFDGEIRLR